MTTIAHCPSDWALERYLLGELSDNASSVADHIATCAACRAKVVAKEIDGAAFLRSSAAAEMKRRFEERGASTSLDVPPRRERTFSRRNVAVLAAVAAIGIVVAVGRRHAWWHDSSAGDEQVVLRVQREWMEAVRDNDDAALDRILADDYTYTDSRGAVSTKADSLRQARAHRGGITRFEQSDAKTSIHGDVAVITGRLWVEGLRGGQRFDAEVRFTDILARIDGRWRAIAAHASRPGDASKKE